MSDLIAQTIVLSVMFGPFYCIYYLVVVRPNKAWLSWPTLAQYWTAHPECKTNSGIKCYHCHSKNIRQHGWKNRTDRRRVHKCNQCGNQLYRT